MSEERFRSDLPYLRAYLGELTAVPPIRRQFFLPWGCLLSVATPFVVGGGLIAAGLGVFGGILGVIAFPLALAISAVIDQRVKRPRNEAERRAVERFDRFKNYGPSAARGRLARDLEPTAATILEACALHRARIQATLKTPAWEARASTDHWRSVRDQALQAADDAMAEAFMLCDPFFGRDFGNRKQEWAEVAREFLLGDTDRAVNRAQEMIVGARLPEAGAVDQLPPALRPAYDVAQKMRSLAREVEALSAQAAQQEASIGLAQPGQASGLDLALENLRSVRDAEKELEEQLRIQPGP